jgi:hypothetical protein
MLITRRRPATVGEVLVEEFMPPMRLTQARDIRYPPPTRASNSWISPFISTGGSPSARAVGCRKAA